MTSILSAQSWRMSKYLDNLIMKTEKKKYSRDLNDRNTSQEPQESIIAY